MARFLPLEKTVTPAASLRSNQEPEEKQRQQTDLTSVAEGDVRRSQAPTPFPRGNADPPSDKRTPAARPVRKAADLLTRGRLPGRRRGPEPGITRWNLLSGE
jgi:hypothetical protein